MSEIINDEFGHDMLLENSTNSMFHLIESPSSPRILKRVLSTEDNESVIIDLLSDSFPSMNRNYVPLKSPHLAHVTVTKVAKEKKIDNMDNLNVGLSHLISETNIDSSVEPLFNTRPAEESQIKSPIMEIPVMLSNESEQLKEDHFDKSGLNCLRVIHVPSPKKNVHRSSSAFCDPSIIVNTIRLDENSLVKPLTNSDKKNKGKVSVTCVRSNHNKPTAVQRESQIETIELPVFKTRDQSQTLSPSTVRIERIHQAKHKSKSATVAPCDSTPKEQKLTDKKDIGDREAKSGVVVKRVPRETITKSAEETKPNS